MAPSQQHSSSAAPFPPPGTWRSSVAITLLVLLGAANIVAVLFVVSLQEEPSIATVGNASASLLVIAFVALGVLNRHRLAWQWARVISVLGILGLLASLAMVLVGAVLSVLAAGPDAGLTVYIIGFWVDASRLLLLVSLFILFGTPAARDHFGLRCPHCGGTSVRANDFFFRHAVCKTCLTVW